MSAGRSLVRAGALVSAAGAACLAYAALVEVDAFVLRRWTIPVLPAGAQPIRILHLSDLHLLPSQTEKQAWVSQLAALEPDLVVDTGDNLAHVNAVPYLLRALGRLLERPGVYVMGSNDYFPPKPKSPFVYFKRRTGVPRPVGELPWRDMTSAFDAAGWADLDDRRAVLRLRGLTVEFRGTDDAHLARDNYDAVAGPASPGVDLSIGVTHAPYLRVIDQMADDGCELILAGHTHGGQVCVPGLGALVTNCDLDRKRAKGVSQHRGAALHVCAGLGTSPYAPVRFACRPEASLLTLVPR